MGDFVKVLLPSYEILTVNDLIINYFALILIENLGDDLQNLYFLVENNLIMSFRIYFKFWSLLFLFFFSQIRTLLFLYVFYKLKNLQP